MKRIIYRWRVSHPEHGSTEVVGVNRYEAILAAAKITAVESSAKQAHHRIDRLERRGESEE